MRLFLSFMLLTAFMLLTEKLYAKGFNLEWVQDVKGCYIFGFKDTYHTQVTLEWTGACIDNKAQGQGMLIFKSDNVPYMFFECYNGGYANKGFIEGNVILNTSGDHELTKTNMIFNHSYTDYMLYETGTDSENQAFANQNYEESTKIQPEKHIVIVDKNWIRDEKTGCSVFNENPQPGESITWSGGCSAGKAKGKGFLQWYKNGEPTENYSGEFKDGKPNGQGTYKWETGDEYHGQWKDGYRHGHGVYTSYNLFSQASIYDGGYNYNKRNGRGTITEFGTQYKTVYDSDKLIQKIAPPISAATRERYEREDQDRANRAIIEMNQRQKRDCQNRKGFFGGMLNC